MARGKKRVIICNAIAECTTQKRLIIIAVLMIYCIIAILLYTNNEEIQTIIHNTEEQLGYVVSSSHSDSGPPLNTTDRFISIGVSSWPHVPLKDHTSSPALSNTTDMFNSKYFYMSTHLHRASSLLVYICP